MGTEGHLAFVEPALISRPDLRARLTDRTRGTFYPDRPIDGQSLVGRIGPTVYAEDSLRDNEDHCPSSSVPKLSRKLLVRSEADFTTGA